jgi:uncharacterized membrane protein YeaQ/YmgE (transglycosylase-associated protein family)
MSLLEILILLVIAGLAGTIAEFVIGFSPGGLLFSIIIGVLGAYIGIYIGAWLTRVAGAPHLLAITVGRTTIDIVWATLGSLLLVGLLSLLRGRRTAHNA